MPSTRSNQPSFESLDAALLFIELQWDEDNAAELFDACLDDCVSSHMSPVIFERLQATHADKRLSSLYLDRSPPLAFPMADKTFKLGGHNKELGHIHIDFQKTGHRWQLVAIWMCR